MQMSFSSMALINFCQLLSLFRVNEIVLGAINENNNPENFFCIVFSATGSMRLREIFHMNLKGSTIQNTNSNKLV